MRSAEQIGRTVGEWHDFQRAERDKALREFLSLCKAARAAGESWIGWIDAGCPDVTTAAGAAFAIARPSRLPSKGGAFPEHTPGRAPKA